MSGGLKLKAEDADDLQVISAAVQDAILRAGDAAFDAKARRFSMVLNRFRWEEAGVKGRYSRVRSVLSFEDVLAIRTRSFRRDIEDAVAQVLSVGFTPAPEPPGGAVEVTLAGGGAIRLDVEALDGALIDVSDPWPTPNRPDHDKSGIGGKG